MGDGETYSHEGIECPACGYVNRDDLPYDEETTDWQCEHCDAQLEVHPSTTYSWTTELKKGTQ